jgi:D-ribose pyranase
MKKTGILNSEISKVVALMGHTDFLVICDSGFPIPEHVRRIDLALSRGFPGVVQTAAEIAKELAVEGIMYCRQAEDHCPELMDQIKGMFPEASTEVIEHALLKEISTKAKAIIRTGECVPYSNVILRAGVAF